MSDVYAAEYRRRLREEPIKQRVRHWRFNARLAMRRESLRRYDAALARPDVVATPSELRPPAHRYRGYAGPWIEDFFFRAWADDKLGSLPVPYLPIFWTDYYLHCQTLLYSPAARNRIDATIERILHEELDPNRGYFTILEYDHPIWDWHRFSQNVMVFSAGGGGDVPIPLLNGERTFRCAPKDILVSFMGQLDGPSNHGGVRRRMYAACREIAVFGSGPTWRDVMQRSTFTLCPRGLGRASFRLYEALSCGSIPIYIWDDAEWLPWSDEIDWTEIAISVNVDDVERIPDIIRSQTSVEIRAKQEAIRALHDDYFTFAGTCRQIVRRLERLSLEDVRSITACRTFANVAAPT